MTSVEPGTTALVLGVPSGKSTWAEAQLAGLDDVTYVATSDCPDDPEWAERVALHVARRPASWTTVETFDVAGALASGTGPVLVDCVALWLDRALDRCGAWSDADGWESRLRLEVDALVAAVVGVRRTVLLVTNEVGLGVVPATRSGRIYRDELGRVNMRLAEVADGVWLLVAGIPVRVK